MVTILAPNKNVYCFIHHFITTGRRNRLLLPSPTHYNHSHIITMGLASVHSTPTKAPPSPSGINNLKTPTSTSKLANVINDPFSDNNMSPGKVNLSKLNQRLSSSASNTNSPIGGGSPRNLLENLVTSGKNQSKNFALQVGLGAGLREQEKIMDELKKENFDLKLRCYHLEDQLRKQTPANTSELLSENESLRTSQEALNIECRTLRDCLSECQVSLEKAKLQNSNTSAFIEEISSLKEDLALTQNQLSKSSSQIKNYEQQLEVFDIESRDNVKKIRKLEMMKLELKKEEQQQEEEGQKSNSELEELREELSLKVGFLEQIRQESRQLHADLELSHRQRQELEAKIRLLEEGRQYQHHLQHQFEEDQTPGTPNSSGIDVMETRMVNQIGKTSAQLSELSRSNELSLSERENLQNQLTTLNLSSATIVKSLQRFYERLVSSFDFDGNLIDEDLNSNPKNKSAEYWIKALNDATIQLAMEFSSSKEKGEYLEKECKAQKEINLLSQRDHKERLSSLEERLLSEREEKDHLNSSLLKAKKDILALEQQLRNLNENELPRYKEQLVQQQHSLRTLEEELSNRQDNLQSLRQKEQEKIQIISSLESERLRLNEDFSSLKAEMSNILQKNESINSKLAMQEQVIKEMNSLLREEKEKLSSSLLVKEKIEERFKGEMKSLHQSNSDLRSQLGNLSSGKNVNEERLQRLQGHLRYLEGVNDEMVKKASQRSGELSSLQKEHNSLLDERQILSQKLKVRESELSSLKEEISLLRKSDSIARRGAEGLSHLEGRIESLQSTNQLLRTQLEERDLQCKESEERLKRQDGAIRKAYSDCEQQSARIKKREQVISRVLKRLENINGPSSQQHLTDLASLQNDEEFNGNGAKKNKNYESNLRF